MRLHESLLHTGRQDSASGIRPERQADLAAKIFPSGNSGLGAFGVHHRRHRRITTVRRILSCCAALFVVLILLEIAPVAHANALTTVAGDGNQATGCLGKTINGPIAAINVSLNFPSGVAKDAAGNLYVADAGDNCVLVVDANGSISDAGIIGNGTAGFAGDGQYAAGGINGSTELNNPVGVAVDSSGNLYIADTFNSRIRKVDTNGIITTVAGGGSLRDNDGTLATDVQFSALQGVAVDAAGNLYVSDSGFEKVYKVDVNGILTKVAGSGGSTYNGDGGPAITANLIPMGIAIDGAGNLYIADWSNGRIRMVDTSGIIHTVIASLSQPRGVAVDSSGNVYVADTGHHEVLKVNTSAISTVLAGDGTAGNINGELSSPSGVAVDTSGNVYIADSGNQVVRALLNYNTPVGDQVTVSLGGGTTVTFAHVSAAGNTTVTASGVGPAPPTGYQFGNPPTFLDVSTTASYTAPVTVCMVYDPPQFIDINALKLFHNESSGLVDVTISNDTTNHVICGQVAGLSVFVIAEPIVTWNLTLNTTGTGSGTVSGGGTYNSGQTATVSATAGAGSSFTGWSGPDSAECQAGSVVMNADKSCTATFTLNSYNLTASGTPQRAQIGTSFGPLQVTVKDGGGNPVSGVTVTFAAPTSGASGTFAGGANTATTNSSGVATSATFTANSTAGTYQVEATVASGGTPATFTLTNVDFYLSQATASTVQITAGTPAPVALDLSTAPASAALPADVNYTCSVPASLIGTTCALNPVKTSAGSTSGTTTLTITTTANVPPPTKRQGPWGLYLLSMMAAALMLSTALFLATRQKPVWLRGLPVYLSLALLIFALAGFVGCSSPSTSTPKGPATVTVTAISGALSKTTTININVN
jgi:sugar lactone lactonase YvrE